MHFRLRKCMGCKTYTLKLKCPHCNSKTEIAHPARFSPDDKYLRYRLPERYEKN